MMPRGKQIVHVATHSVRALAEPTFIIKQGDVFYLTLAVHAYDERDATRPEQFEAIARIRDNFERALENEVPCVPTTFTYSSGPDCVQTDPPCEDTLGGGGGGGPEG